MKSFICASAANGEQLINFEIKEKTGIYSLIKSVRISKGKFEKTEIKNEEELQAVFEELKGYTVFKECNVDFSTKSMKISYTEMIDFLQAQFNINKRNIF